MLKLQCLVIIALFSVYTLKAQESKNSSFIIMSSHGYMKSGFGTSGSGHINTFLYSPSKLWAYGVDLSVSQGRSLEVANKILNLSLSPSIYLFPLNREKHQIYLGANAGVGYTDGLNEKRVSYNSIPSTMGFTFGTNAGYNYKFKKHWMVGARIYYNYNLYSVTSDGNLRSSIMGLISVGYRF